MVSSQCILLEIYLNPASCICQINVQNIKISEELQALIAPAILPRSFLSLQVTHLVTEFLTLTSYESNYKFFFLHLNLCVQILQYLRNFKAQIPVRDPGRYIILNHILINISSKFPGYTFVICVIILA